VDLRLEVVQVPVSDVDRAKAFYVEQAELFDDPDGNGWAVQEIPRPRSTP
jgi:hypothetical protein